MYCDKKVLLVKFFLMVLLALVVLTPVLARAEVEPSASWEAALDTVTVSFVNLSLSDVADYTWNGQIVTDEVSIMLSSNQAEITPTPDGFKFTVKDVDHTDDGEFGVVRRNGEIVSIPVPSLLIPSQKRCAPEAMSSTMTSSQLSEALGATTCGKDKKGNAFKDSTGNPYPCCENGKRPKGNCTWYVWYRAHQTYHGWGQPLPTTSWHNATDWCKNAKGAGYVVSDKPRGADEGYSIGCHVAPIVCDKHGKNCKQGYGHVAWVWKYDDKYVWVDEQNCCDCAIAGYREGAKWARSYFQYIYKK